MPVHKKVARAAKKVGKTVLKRFGVRFKAPAKKRIRKTMQKRLRRRPVASSISRGPKQIGPPKIGFRTIKGRGGRRITIKRPSPRLAGPAFAGRRNPIQRPGISGNPRRRERSA